MSTACLELPIAVPSVRKEAVRQRHVGLDVARVLAAYSIVWLHTPRFVELQASTALGRFAVPFFVFAAVFLVVEGAGRHPDRTFGQYAWSRVKRIYVPFLAWSGIYLAFKALKAVFLPEQPNCFPGINFLWEGSFYHLWFMPFILVVSVACFAVAKAAGGRESRDWTIGGAALTAGIALASIGSPLAPLDGSPYGRLIDHALPSVCWALALALVYRHLPARWLQRPEVALAAVVLVTGGTAWIWHAGEVVKWAETLAGLGVMLLALRPVRSPWLSRFARLGPLAYGIYLSHLLFIKVFESLTVKLGLPVSWQADLTVFLVSAALSTLLAWTLNRWSPTRWLVA